MRTASAGFQVLVSRAFCKNRSQSSNVKVCCDQIGQITLRSNANSSHGHQTTPPDAKLCSGFELKALPFPDRATPHFHLCYVCTIILLLCRYQIQYTVSDANNVAATSLTISITFVEVALVTGSFLFIGQANSTSSAQVQAQQLNTIGATPNAAFTTAVASVFQSWLTSATSSYVGQLTATLGTTAATVAATNTIELGLFSSVLTADVTVLNVALDQNATMALNVNSSEISQNYAFNVTLQVVVITADMLLSVFVDVLNSTYTRRRLLGSSAVSWTQPDAHHETSQAMQTSPEVTSLLLDKPPLSFQQPHQSLVASKTDYTRQPETQMHSSRSSAVTSTMQQERGQSMLAPEDKPLEQPIAGVISHSRSLQSSGSSSTVFPLASLLQFKMDMLLAAFSGTSGCSTDSLTDLFYEDSEAPDTLAELCGDDGGSQDLSLNTALLGVADSSVPLLQVGCMSSNVIICCLGFWQTFMLMRHRQVGFHPFPPKCTSCWHVEPTDISCQANFGT